MDIENIGLVRIISFVVEVVPTTYGEVLDARVSEGKFEIELVGFNVSVAVFWKETSRPNTSEE